jgi:predicted Rossmann fold nucleotide-binding protein DprA/Smf involved in DNA uptake
MKHYYLLLFAILWSFLPAIQVTAQVGATPIPPGIRAADKTQEQSDRRMEPPATGAHKMTNAQLTQQADELLSLAQQVHSEVQQATQGLLAKDLGGKLKRLEKLSKELRQELLP